tara:strand:- start:1598 stop:2071 length:474 start_codon:yes stop_codon:yes gene_type:complete
MKITYYNIKYFISQQINWINNCFKYKKVLEHTYDFDYHSSLLFMKEHFASISTAMKEEKYVVEEEKERAVRQMELDRVVELIHNVMEDNFADRCGYDDDFEIVFLDDEDSEYMTSETTITEEQRENNAKALEKAILLEEKEWKEFIRLLKNMKTWWI